MSCDPLAFREVVREPPRPVRHVTKDSCGVSQCPLYPAGVGKLPLIQTELTLFILRGANTYSHKGLH